MGYELIIKKPTMFEHECSKNYEFIMEEHHKLEVKHLQLVETDNENFFYSGLDVIFITLEAATIHVPTLEKVNQLCTEFSDVVTKDFPLKVEQDADVTVNLVNSVPSLK